MVLRHIGMVYFPSANIYTLDLSSKKLKLYINKWDFLQSGSEPADIFQIGIHYRKQGILKYSFFNIAKYAIILLNINIKAFFKLHLHSCKRFWKFLYSVSVGLTNSLHISNMNSTPTR